MLTFCPRGGDANATVENCLGVCMGGGYAVAGLEYFHQVG